jgi:SET domain-containing protein
MIKIDFSEIDGRGVFATKQIKVGTELTCDVMLFDNSVKTLSKWSYPWNKTHFSFCVGFGSFFNHNDIPNVKIKSINREKLTKTFVVIKEIKKGNELFLNYGKNKFG